MNFELQSQSVQYTFINEAKYGKNGKTRIYNNVDPAATGQGLHDVGEALADLQGDTHTDSVLIIRKAVKAQA